MLGFMGCAVAEKVLPVHDEILIYNLPYDLTFLRVMEAVDAVPGWDLQLTKKAQGIIQARNINFSQFGDADKRQVTVLLRSLGRKETSVQLAPESQRVIGGGKILERISLVVSREL